ncbi:MAG: acyl-CoA/acyl-ACP dehydrogenase [Deltaproteobacteria bacterium]|nr:acyl-CoA/acyl-ACP dehydrogenase [Deltaproteobacteria bacterium]
MDLAFSEEQLVLRDMVRSLCAELCPLEVVREMERDPKSIPTELWKQLGELGLLGVWIPEAYGGSGQGLLDAVIVHEELGRALVPSPAFESAILSGRALLAVGSDDQKRAWLPRIVTGEAILTPAWLEPQSGFGPKGVQLRATRSGVAWKLSGPKRFVSYANSAERLLVLARTGEAATDITAFLVDPRSPGVSLAPVESLGSERQFDVSFDSVAVDDADRLGDENAGWLLWDQVMHEAIIVLAARAMGGCRHAFEMTVQYAKDRKQFDKPLGAFQSISHYLADAVTELDGGTTLVYQAAWARDEGKDIRRLAPMAKLFACNTFRDVTATCQQIWGGVGFSIEYDIQLFFRRAKQMQISWWDKRMLEELVAADVLD